MKTSETHKIRPAGRHIITIGRELIQDGHAAIIELVKNAYDADSPDVSIEFDADADNKSYRVSVSDHGHGMSRSTVVNSWMVPSTPDKLNRRLSPSGRIMQGRKGVGRYAASVLGTDLLLETITEAGQKTTVYVVWKDFEQAEYLDEVEVLIESVQTAECAGTQLVIEGGKEFFCEWDQSQFNDLLFELKKLKSPVSSALLEDQFCISLVVCGFPSVSDIAETIEPYPIFDLFDYKIAGLIKADGRGELEYSSQKARNMATEAIPLEIEGNTGCGELYVDIRVYDRDKDAISSLIARGLKDESGKYVGKMSARALLNKYNGIGVYRNGFRIRPLGDPDFDWLKLNEQRVQNPSLRIGSNQVIGYVQIQSEDQSGLVEKSARDGLKENAAFLRLKRITAKILAELEARRFGFRRKAGLSRRVLRVERELEQLFSFEELKQDVKAQLDGAKLDKGIAEEILGLISRDEAKRNQVADDIRQAVAIYQGQATLGKIINIVLHEGRRPLNYFSNQIPNLQYWHEEFRKAGNVEYSERILRIAKGIGENAQSFATLFSRLDPLAVGKRTKKQTLPLKTTLAGVIDLFEGELRRHGVRAIIEGEDKFKYAFWRQDIHAIFANLIDNSLYWITEKESPNREIAVTIVVVGCNLSHIDYRDTGPGIEQEFIEGDIIFEPEFSTKPSGTGLGLAIAGEAAFRNGLELKALASEQGAWFRLQPIAE